MIIMMIMTPHPPRGGDGGVGALRLDRRKFCGTQVFSFFFFSLAALSLSLSLSLPLLPTPLIPSISIFCIHGRMTTIQKKTIHP